MRSDRDLERDLARWEEGDLLLDELEARWGDTGVRGIVETHGMLHATAGDPVPDAEAGWEELRGRLPDRAPVGAASRRRHAAARRLLVAAAATLVLGGIAYAAAPEAARERLGALWDRVRSVFVAEQPAPRDRTGDVSPSRELRWPTGFVPGPVPSDDDEDEDDGDDREADDRREDTDDRRDDDEDADDEGRGGSDDEDEKDVEDVEDDEDVEDRRERRERESDADEEGRD